MVVKPMSCAHARDATYSDVQQNVEIGIRQQSTERSAPMASDQITFYDESLKKQIEGYFVSDGKEIQVSSVYGTKSASYGDLGPCIDYNAQVLLVQKLLSELARDAAKDKKSH
jgi:hypothetical protein